MKKCIALILSLIYLSTSSGIVMNVQYCFEEIASVKIQGFGKDKCCCTNSSDKSGCCSNELKVFKVDVSHVPSTADFNIGAPFYFIKPLSFFNVSPVLLCPVKLLQSSDNSPPLAAAIPIYIKNCVFRI